MCAFLSVQIYTYVEPKGWTIKMPAGVPPTVGASFAALIPAEMEMSELFTNNFLYGLIGTNVFQIIFEFLQTPFLNLGDTLGAMVVAYIFFHLFWFFYLEFLIFFPVFCRTQTCLFFKNTAKITLRTKGQIVGNVPYFIRRIPQHIFCQTDFFPADILLDRHPFFFMKKA